VIASNTLPHDAATHTAYDVIDTDILLALALHVLVIGGLLLFALYYTDDKKKPLQRIEVSMITAQALAKLLPTDETSKLPKPHKPQPNPVVEPTPAPIAKPELPQPTAKSAPELSQPTAKPASELPAPPVIEAKPKPPKPVIEPKPTVKVSPPKPVVPTTHTSNHKAAVKAAKATKHHHKNANPFAPITSNRKPHHRTVPRINQAELVVHQLSKKELERYIAMMQAAVQRHWKVPIGLRPGVRDPLVRVDLERSGAIRRITIIETSGQSSLDQTLIAAIRAASPFTIPREQYAVFKNNSIRFHPRKRGDNGY